MRKTAIALLAVLAVAFLAAPVLRADRRADFQAVQKAVKSNPAYEEGKEIHWFKVLVTDAKTNKDKVKITLPIALVEAFVNCAGDKHVRMDRGDCDIDFKTLWNELKKVGPMSLIEINEDDEIVKVWFE